MIDNEKLRAALTLAADFTATAQAVSDAHAEQQAILQAVRERIAADKRRAERCGKAGRRHRKTRPHR